MSFKKLQMNSNQESFPNYRGAILSVTKILNIFKFNFLTYTQRETENIPIAELKELPPQHILPGNLLLNIKVPPRNCLFLTLPATQLLLPFLVLVLIA